MIRVFNKLLEGKTLFPIQNKQYSERILLEDTLQANETKLCKTSVSFIGHFLCQYITGNYQTLSYADPDEECGPSIVDDGICHLRGQLIDGAGSTQIFSDFVPFDLLLSPGRIRSRTATNNLIATILASKADNAPSLFYPTNLEYLFTANSDIQMNVKNDSDVAISFSILFAGIRVKVTR